MLFALGYPGFGAWPLALFGAALLLVALSGARTVAAGAALGWLWCATAATIGFRFVAPTIERFGGVPRPAAIMLLVALAAVEALRGAVLGAVTLVGARATLPLPVAFVVATPIAESMPVPIEWTLAAPLVDATWLVQIDDLCGPPLTAAVFTSLATLIACPALTRLARPRIGGRAVALCAALPVLATLYGVVACRRVDAATMAAPSLRVGVVSTPAGAPDAAPDRHTLERLTERQRGVEAERVDLVVWPEAVLPFPLGNTPADDALAQLGGAVVVPTLVGAVVDETTGDARAWHNAAVALAPRGLVGRRDKQVLLPFSEYLPFERRLPWLRSLSPASGRFSPGPSRGPVAIAGAVVDVSICYEDVLAHTGSAAPEPANLLANMSNDAWFVGSDEAEIHLALARFRAIERRRFLVRATSGGISAVVDAAGRVVRRTDAETGRAIVDEVRLLDLASPHATTARLGPWPWWVLLAGLVARAAMVARRARAGAA